MHHKTLSAHALTITELVDKGHDLFWNEEPAV